MLRFPMNLHLVNVKLNVLLLLTLGGGFIYMCIAGDIDDSK